MGAEYSLHTKPSRWRGPLWWLRPTAPENRGAASFGGDWRLGLQPLDVARGLGGRQGPGQNSNKHLFLARVDSCLSLSRFKLEYRIFFKMALSCLL